MHHHHPDQDQYHHGPLINQANPRTRAVSVAYPAAPGAPPFPIRPLLSETGRSASENHFETQWIHRGRADRTKLETEIAVSAL